MKCFDEAGLAMLQVEEGNRQLAFAMQAAVLRWWNAFKAWQHGMPVTLPPIGL